MKASIDVKDRKEADNIRAGLADPVARAFVVVIGLLSGLPSDRARNRVMAFVQDHFSEAEAEDSK